jgi:hypothetical protein
MGISQMGEDRSNNRRPPLAANEWGRTNDDAALKAYLA